MNLTFSLSLFFVFFISSLLFHNSLSLSLITLSVTVGIFWCGSGVGCSSSLMIGCDSCRWWVAQARWRWVGFCVLWCDGGNVDLNWCWSSCDGAMFVVFWVFWLALIWCWSSGDAMAVLIWCWSCGSAMCVVFCVFSNGILVEVLLNNCLGFDSSWSGSIRFFFFNFLFLF